MASHTAAGDSREQQDEMLACEVRTQLCRDPQVWNPRKGMSWSPLLSHTFRLFSKSWLQE